jgi:WD40 repeat protein
MALAFSPTGTLLASASTDHTAKLFDLASGKERFTLTGHKARVQCVAFRSDGRIVATVSDDQTARLWDSRTGQTILVLRPQLGPALTVAFSPDGQQLAVASNEKTVLYRFINESAKQVLFGHRYQVLSLAFHPVQPVLASASGDNSIRLWNLVSGTTQQRIPGHHQGQPRGLAFSPDGALLAAGHCGYFNYRPTDHGIRLWDTATGALHDTLAGHDAEISCVAFDPPGTSLASGDNQGTTLLQNWTTRAGLQRWQRPGDTVVGLCFGAPDQLVIAYLSGQLQLCDCRTGRITTQTEVDDKLNGLSFSPLQKRLATGTEQGVIKVLDFPSLALVRTIQASRGDTEAVALTPDGRLLASGGGWARVTLWDAGTGLELLQFPPQESPVYDLAFDPAGARLAICGVEEQITVWNLAAVRARLKALGIDWGLPAARVAASGL